MLWTLDREGPLKNPMNNPNALTLDREGLSNMMPIRISLVPLRNMNLVSSKKLVVKNPMTSDPKSKARSVQSLKIISALDFSFESALHDPRVA